MRLTKKREDGHYDDLDECVSTRCSDKLGKLEDIEEELGIDLITLAKAMMNGIYDKEDRMRYPVSFLRFSDYFFQIEDKDGKYGKLLLYKDYGKIWALTKEELE